MDHIPELVWLCILGTFSVAYSVLNSFFMLPFWKYRNSRFITSRKPSLLLFYGVLSSLLLLVVVPNICYATYALTQQPDQPQLSQSRVSLHFFVFDVTFEATFITLVHVIAVRVWLLFYDYKFAMATVDRVWRKVLNPSDRNFFLNHRSSFGNSKFLLRAVIVIWLVLLFVITMMALTFNTYYASSALMNMDEVIFFTIKIVIGLPVLLFVFVIHRKIHQINDQFNIKKEVKYLSYLVLFVILTSLIAVALLIFAGIPVYQFEVIVYTFDVAFVCGSCYIQSKWALHSMLGLMRKSQTESVNVPLTMADILRNKRSFELFMRHCVTELSVESLLFLVEVAQYKATLVSYNVTDVNCNFLSINVKTTNLRELLLSNRRQKNTEEDASLLRTNSLRHNSLQRSNSNQARTRYSLALSMVFRKSSDMEEDDDSDHTGNGKPATPDPVNSSSPLPATAHRTDARILSQFRQFQQSILDRKWLPISMQLNVQKAPMETSLITQDELKSKTLRNLKLTVIQHDEKAQAEMVDAPSNSMSYSVSQAAAVGDPLDVMRSQPSLRAGVGSVSGPSVTVTCEDIREIAVFLFEKYIKTDSDWCINVASDTRVFLQDLFGLPSEKMFEYILEKSGGTEDKSPQCPAAINTQLLINTYIYHVYDAAFEEVWNLLHKDTFRRFVTSDAYRKLVKIHLHIKDEEEKPAENGIYSKTSTATTEQP